MADVNRTLVDKLVLHHAVTPLWQEKSKADLAQWFSDNGYVRGYGSNAANWSGLTNPYTGARSYSQAHFAGQQVDGSTPDATDAERAAGYRLVQLVNDPWGQITWHAGNWAVNCSSIGIENLGDYRNYTLRDGDARVIADFWRGRDQQLGGATAIYGHKEVTDTSTECPARIMEMRDTIVGYVNNAPVVVPPTPPAPSAPTWSAYGPTRLQAAGDINLVDVTTGGVVKTYPAGTQFDVDNKTDWNGKTYVRTPYSTTSNVNNGFDLSALAAIPVITTDEVQTNEVIPFTKTTFNDDTLAVGETKITQAGVDGNKLSIFTVTYTNGVETSRELKSETVTLEPKAEITAIGTYVKPSDPTTPTKPSTDFKALIGAIVLGLAALVAAISNWLFK